MIEEKRIIRIARAIMADGEEEEKDEIFDSNDFFLETVKKTDFSGKGFYVSDENSDEITWMYKGDDLESCYIVFGESEGSWGYTAVVGGDEVEQETDEDIRKAWDKLNMRIDALAVAMSDFANEESAEMEDEIAEEKPEAPLGKCGLSQVEDDMELKKDNIFSLMYDAQSTATYEAVFMPDATSDGSAVEESIKYIKNDLSNGMPVFRKRGSKAIRFQTVNKQDLDYVKSLIQKSGWILA